MPRQVRFEFAGAFYHVVARGNRRAPIFFQEDDYTTFLRTLGVACERSGMRVHAYVLMTNHYHLLVETPEPNLSMAMGWLQNAFMRRMNVKHQLWGRLFGDRYKSILVEPGNAFWDILDYIHLNPVRAGMVDSETGIEQYEWSSLKFYLTKPNQRPEWLETSLGFSVCGCPDRAQGRRQFLSLLDERIDWDQASKAGVDMPEEKQRFTTPPGVSMRRGWYFGSQEFGEKVADMFSAKLEEKTDKRADGYHGNEVQEHGAKQAEAIVAAGLQHFKLETAELEGLSCNDVRKCLIAELVWRNTGVRLDWVRNTLKMGDRSYCSRLIKQMKMDLSKTPNLRGEQTKIENMMSKKLG